MTPPAADWERAAAGAGVYMPFSIQVASGADAHRQARRQALSELDGGIVASRADDAALIVSELVTNSVRHAGLRGNGMVTVDLAMLKDRLRITVSDGGSELEPRLLPTNPDVPGGFGLRLVDDLSLTWGIAHDPDGATHVWCDLEVPAG
jgi:two-component sensor histidine kinase